MYTVTNFKTKKQLKDAVAAHPVPVQRGIAVHPEPTDGVAFIEGPHYPQPHRWYAKVMLEDSNIVKVLS